MAWEAPTQAQIHARNYADLETELPGADARLRRTFERVLVKVLGKAGFYGNRHLEWISKQIFEDTSDEEFLDRKLSIWGVSDGAGGFGRKPATNASGYVQIGGTSGSVSIGDIMTREDGTRFVCQENESWTGPYVKSILFEAEDVGAAGNTDAGETLEFESVHAGLTNTGTVGPDGIDGGADRESKEDALARLLQKIRDTPSGGGPGDYVTWALEASTNVTRAWELPNQLGPGTVQVLIANDNIPSVAPSASTVSIVQDYLQKVETATGGWEKITGVAPVSAVVTVTAVATKTLNYAATVELESGAVQATVKAAIEAAVAAMIKRLAEPGVTITTSQILAAIMGVQGVKTATLTTPAADVTHTTTQIPIVGSFTPTWS